MATAVYPGTFDPPTRGHLDLIERGSRLFDRLIVAVGPNPAKTTLFSTTERVRMLRRLAAPFPNVEVKAFRGLVVDFVRRCDARVILRGIRTFSDFEYEFAMALTNRSLARDIETVFVMPSLEYSFTSSRLIKEASALGADVTPYVHESVVEAMAVRERRTRKRKKG